MAFRLVGCALALVLGCASWVQAQGVSVLRITSTANGPLVTCEALFSCSSAGTQGCDNGQACVSVVDNGLAVCLPTSRPLALEPFCCHTLDDCPQRGDAEAVGCQVVAGDVSVCLYDAPLRNLLSLCRPLFATLAEAVATCYAPASIGGGRASLALGDCDGDGLNNAEDWMDPCTVPPVLVEDAGVAEPDLGVDGGTGLIAPPIDQGGTTRVDLGAIDAGTATGTPTPGFQGGGGCYVAAEGQGATSLASFGLFASLAGLVARRRRRR